MTPERDEAEARETFATGYSVSRETMWLLDAYVALLRTAARHQNLIAESTIGTSLWQRHIADSAQLLRWAPVTGGRWVDLGSGPGLPGLVIATLAPDWQVTLIESRGLRCQFLSDAISELDLSERVTVHQERVEAHRSSKPYDVISARAFAPLPRLLSISSHLAGAGTRWLLPKGRNAVNELSTLPSAWQEMFHVEPSLTDSDAKILIGTGRFA